MIKHIVPDAIRAALCVGACLIGTGCTYRLTGEGPGELTFSAPGVLPSGPLEPPPIGLAGAASTIPPAPAPRTGLYAGVGRILSNPGGLCGDPIRVTNFRVNGNNVSFGAFQGTIQPSGALTMQLGPRYVYGQFIDTHFEGRFVQPQPSCTYALSLEPVGN